MNWSNLINLLDTTAIAVVALGLAPSILMVIAKIKEAAHESDKHDDQPVKIGQKAKMVIEDPMACEKYEILEDRMEIYGEQIILYNKMLKKMQEDLAVEFNVTRITKLQMDITNMKMKINMTKDKTDKITQEMDKIIMEYGQLVSVSDS